MRDGECRRRPQLCHQWRSRAEGGGVQYDDGRRSQSPIQAREIGKEEHLNGSTTAIVVGGGIFGLTAALELRNRGYAVTLLNDGPIPHPLAASTDISKVMRIE